MSSLSRILLVCSFLCAGKMHTYAQGCSDAGFCSAGAMQSAAHMADSGLLTTNSIAFSFTAGSGEQGTSIFIPQLEFQKQVGKKGIAELKLPYYFASGNLGHSSGIGDPVVTYTHTILQKTQWSLHASGGLRISTGNADKQLPGGLSLPMPYQANLGTTDIILGLSVNWTKYLTIAAGYQQPVIRYNENNYLPIPVSTAETTYPDYFASRKLKRKGDVLLRAEGHCAWRRFSVSAGPLFIYHLGKDKITNIAETEVALDGSEGLTLNLAGNVAWTNKSWKADVSAGTPFIVRSYRPDGLTREWVVTPRISFFFK